MASVSQDLPGPLAIVTCSSGINSGIKSADIDENNGNLGTSIANQGPTTPPPSSSLPPPGKKATRNWDAWTRQEEENFFVALRQVGKNFEKITSRVQSKNKEQVRHYYYRLIKRINKILGPDFALDAKNSKDVNSAMLRWWSLLEKHSCSASKLHLKPRRFKTFVTALEHQLLKDRNKAKKKETPQTDGTLATSFMFPPVISNKATTTTSATTTTITTTTTTCIPEFGKAVANGGDSRMPKRGQASKRRVEPRNPRGKGESSRPPRQRRKPSDGSISAAAYKRWEKAASAGVNLVAEAAEQLERAAAAENVDRTMPSIYPSTTDVLQLISNMAEDAPLVIKNLTQDGNMGFSADAQEHHAPKLKLQLFPIDESTRNAMEQDGLNPHLELTLKPRKSVSSILQHLMKKWGQSAAASGELRLFPFYAHPQTFSSHQSWTFHDVAVTAGDVYAVLGKPPVFRLRYAWLQSRLLDPQSSKPQPQPCVASEYEQVARICSGSGTPLEMSEAEDVDRRQGSIPEATCSWLYDGSNGAMNPKIWDEKESNHMALPMEIDWVDCITNISVGELLNEVSQAEHPSEHNSALRIPSAIQPLDSLDGPSMDFPRQERRATLLYSQGSVWGGEETCDAFSFQGLVSQKQEGSRASNPPIGLGEAVSDFGSLEAWKQSFKDAEASCEGHAKMEDSRKIALQNFEESSGKHLSMQEFYWADSLGSLDLGSYGKFRGQEGIFPGDFSLTSLGACSMDVLRNSPLQGNAVESPSRSHLESSVNVPSLNCKGEIKTRVKTGGEEGV